MIGKFYGVGVGPGAADLLTIRAVNILKTVDVVCTPRSSQENESVALKIAKQYIKDTTAILEIATPMTRDKRVLEEAWGEGAEKIVELLKQGKNVAFITLGDSMLFSTYTYLMKRVGQLLPALEIESVPGITSFSAAAAYTNTPLAEGNEQLVVVPAVDDPEKLRDVLQAFPNLVLMKVAGKYEQILDVLTETGAKEQALYISRLGYPDQLVTRNLDDLRGQKRDYLSLIIVKQEER